MPALNQNGRESAPDARVSVKTEGSVQEVEEEKQLQIGEIEIKK